MLLTIDIGNTQTVLGLFDGDSLDHTWRLATYDTRTADELAVVITSLLADRDQWLRYQDARIDFEKPSAPVMAMGEPAGVRLVLTNLLRNAVEAVSGQSDERRVVKITAGPGPTVTVRDSGPGIPAAVRERLFDPFFSTKDGAMRGIGLSLARASVLRMGGDLRIASELGSGTSFSLHLLSPEQYHSLESSVTT